MQLKANFLKRILNEDGTMELCLKIDNIFNQNIAKELKKDVLYSFKISESKSSRSINQNNYMWELIHQIALETKNDDWDIYIAALERSGAKTEYLAITPSGLDLLKEHFRAVKVYNTFKTEKGAEMVQCKVFYGSSKMNTQEMTQLLETIKDIAAECNVPVNWEE